MLGSPSEIIDPRGSLEKARRLELYRFAVENKVSEIKETMPADLMRGILRSKGLTNIAVPNRELGTMQPTYTTPNSHRSGQAQPRRPDVIATVDAEADLAKQWAAQEAATKAVSSMTITELRQECKRRGIKMARTDKMTDLRAKLNE